MNTSAVHDTDVLIVGAGPTGLVLALWLVRLGARVRIVDKAAEAGTTSRAVAVQARTLEFYQQMGMAEAVVAAGRKTIAANMWVTGKRVAHVVFGELGAGLSPFPYALVYPQDEHERFLIERLSEAGVKVERETELVHFEETAEGVAGHLRRADGTEEVCTAAYIAGCDGARSTMRQALRIGFPGGTYEHMFYVADVEASGETMNGELHVALDRSDFLVVFPLQGEGRARLIGTIRQELASQAEKLSWEDVSKRVLEWIRIDVKRVNWFSTYRVHHRVAEHFRRGRAFLLGDAAHIHSPVGGQGMNTGIGDAVNLALEAGRGRRRTSACVDPGQLRGRTHRVCAAIGGDDGPGLCRGDQLRLDGAAVPVTHPAVAGAAAVRIQGDTADDVSPRLADGDRLRGEQPERGLDGEDRGRRPAAVGETGEGRRG